VRYVALLRGINVGGNKLLKMAEVRERLEGKIFKRVTTHSQSGNVLFTARRTGQRELTRRIEEALSKTFAYRSRVVVRSFEQMKAIVDGAPKEFGARPATYRYDVVFLKEPLTADEAMKIVTAKPGVDRVFAGEGVLYFSRLTRRAAQSHLSRVITTPAYQQMTIRNWNTTSKLVELMDGSRSW